MKRKDVSHLAKELTEAIGYLRRSMAQQDATIQRQRGEIAHLRNVQDDIVKQNRTFMLERDFWKGMAIHVVSDHDTESCVKCAMVRQEIPNE